MRSTTQTRRPESPAALRAGLLCAGLVLAGSLIGCAKPLFPQDEARTQFDRYDRSRDEYSPMFTEDEFGRRVPNLQGRLAPKR